MKKMMMAVGFAAMVAAAGTAYAENWSPVGLSLNSKYHFPSWETPVYGLRLGLKAEDLVVRGISLCIVDWQEAAWSWKGCRKRPENMEPAFSGVNVALVGSAVRAEAFAVQVSGLASFAGFDSSVVVQVSGVGCCAVGNGFCLSVAPFLCMGGSNAAVQVAAVNFISGKGTGLQLGIANFAEDGWQGVQIGLLNYIEDGWILPLVNCRF